VGCPQVLAADIPPRPQAAPTGTRFAQQIAIGDSRERERAIEAELLSGNLPSLLRRLRPVTLSTRRPGGSTVTTTVCVMPDYLAVGSDTDFLRIPMDLHTATSVASSLGFVLPTRRMVDAIYAQSEARLTPSPMPAGPEMRSTAYYVTHDSRIREQATALGISLGALLSGQKKDVVMSNLLSRRPGRIAIYGWHRPDGRPIQPLSTVHGAGYADYSHGIRLVSDVVYVGGTASSIYEVLEDPERAALLSDDGPVPDLSAIIPPREARVARLARVLGPDPAGPSGPRGAPG
jgi:hypothetical protein